MNDISRLKNRREIIEHVLGDPSLLSDSDPSLRYAIEKNVF